MRIKLVNILFGFACLVIGVALGLAAAGGFLSIVGERCS